MEEVWDTQERVPPGLRIASSRFKVLA